MKKIILFSVILISLLRATSLQDMYNKAQPGEGYDKLIILSKDSVYEGNFVQDVMSVCIHGNGAFITVNDSSILIDGEGKRLDIDHVIFITDSSTNKVLEFKNDSYGRIVNNTFYGKINTQKTSYCITYDECTKNTSNIGNNIFTYFKTGVYFNTLDFSAGVIYLIMICGIVERLICIRGAGPDPPGHLFLNRGIRN